MNKALELLKEWDKDLDYYDPYAEGGISQFGQRALGIEVAGVKEKVKEIISCGQHKTRGLTMPEEQPNTNAMIFEQVNGSIKVALKLLEQLETKGTDEENQKQGCIWTLKGWHDNNLKHLQKAFE